MALDIIYLGILAWAVYKGVTKGLLMAVFSFVALFIGLAAALKLSAVTANYLKDTINVSAKWLPVLSFILVLVGVVMLVNLAGKLLEETAELAFLGWLNRAGGIVFFALLYSLMWSVFLFYTQKIGLLSDNAMEASVTYPVIAPWGEKVMGWFGEVVPVFKDIFHDLGEFFDQLSGKLEPAPQA
ncbi:CvpA family protein [Flavihumibacter rivuli]|uniref:CvpA family protein n=1 Tax=Flavihumibacter rivuli TaxID=2838156 RepID=UPI001BDEAE15|nr:CvpA family protein [Flavihumibacter rivuli]ULQ56093.1 CvpA family protein [Flavihumibacter rivuli]